MIDSITLENWKTHKNSTMHFCKGTNVMVGVIGSGKSSVTDALCYGLFGTFPALQNRRISTEDLLMRKPFAADTAKVEVCFSIGDKKFRAERIVKRTGTNEGRLYLNDNLLVGPKPSQVTERIEKELQVSYELFSRAVYSEQNQVDYFLKLNPGERKKKFDELLDLQKYETVRGNTNAVLNQFRKHREIHAQSLAQLESTMQNQDMNELRFKLAEQERKREELNTKKQQLLNQQSSLSKEKEILEAKRTQWEKSQQAVHTLTSKRDVLHGQWSSFEKQFPDLASKSHSELEVERNGAQSKIKEYAGQQEQHVLLEMQVQRAIHRKELAEKRLSEWSHAFGGLSFKEVVENQKKMVQQKNELKQKHAGALEKIQEIVSLQRVLEVQLGVLSTDEQSMASLHASCPTCKQEINPVHKGKLVQEIVDKRQQLQQQKADFSAAYTQFVAERNGCETILRTVEEEEKRLAVVVSKAKDGELIHAEIVSSESDLALARTALERFGRLASKEEVEALRERLTKLNKALEMGLVESEKQKVETELTREQGVLSSLSSVPQEHQAMLTRASTIQGEIDACSRETQLVSSLVHELHTHVERAEKLFVQKEELGAKLAHSKDVEEMLNVFSNSLVVTQQQLREGVIEAVNAALVELWPSVYPYEDFTLAKVLIQDNDYSLHVREKSGKWISAESSLSGGERSAAALALRMAIAFVLTRQLSWIILDEPTHNLDSKSVSALSSMLKDRLPNLVDQVFVITHAQEIEKAATGSLYVMQREKNEDGITIPVNKLVDLGTKID